MLEEILKETASADIVMTWRRMLRQIHWKPLSSGTDSLEASQQWDPASLGETTTRGYQVQVYFIYKSKL